MDNKIIYSKTGKGVLEIKNKAGKLARDLVKVLTLVDGKCTVADLISKSKFSDAEMNKALSDLTTAGYIKEFANTSTGTKGGGAGSYVDDLDSTSSLAPTKKGYQNAQSEWRQRETADRAKAEEEAKQKRDQEEQQKKQEAAAGRFDVHNGPHFLNVDRQAGCDGSHAVARQRTRTADERHDVCLSYSTDLVTRYDDRYLARS